LDQREELSKEFELIARELDKAAKHCRVTSNRFSKHEIPAGCAHIFAALGHLSNAKKSIDSCAEIHSLYAELPQTVTHQYANCDRMNV